MFLYPPLCQHLMGGMGSVGRRRSVSSLETQRGTMLRQKDFTQPEMEQVTSALTCFSVLVDDGGNET